LLRHFGAAVPDDLGAEQPARCALSRDANETGIPQSANRTDSAKSQALFPGSIVGHAAVLIGRSVEFFRGNEFVIPDQPA
jgi:hypothetical protein